MTPRGFVATLALAASAVSLGACAATPERPLIDDDQRAAVRSHILNGHWDIVASQYPEAIRPDVAVLHTVPDHEWAQAVVDCLVDHGIRARAGGTGVHYAGSAGLTQLEYAVVNYTCSVQHPAETTVARLLGPRVVEADYRFHVDIVRPCLLIAGAPSPASPNRELADGVDGLAGWNPFQVIWAKYPLGTVLYWERRCPPVPDWLNLGS